MSMAEERVLLLLSPRELECTICAGHYVEPCTLPCGHSFCRGCIERCWKQNDRWHCPICNRKYKRWPELNKNINLAALLEALRAQEPRGTDTCPTCSGPGAVHYCLACMMPLCQEHLSLHSNVSTERRHLLVTLQTATCMEHDSALNSFCIAHSAPVCPSCALQRHSACQTEPLVQHYWAKQERLEGTIRQLDQEITCVEEVIAHQKNIAQQMQTLISDMKDTLIQDFWEMRDYLEQQEQTCLQWVQLAQEKVQQMTAQELQVLIANSDCLKKNRLELQDRLENDWISVLKDEVSEDIILPLPFQKTQYPFDENLLRDATETISSIKRSLLSHPLLGPRPLQTEDILVSQVSPPAPYIQISDMNSPERMLNLQWATSLCFDRETVNCRLRLSDSLKTVMVTNKNRPYQRSDRRFSNSQVLCSQGFSGDRHYWEISTAESDSWAIGVAAPEMRKDSQLGRNASSWCVEWTNGCLCSWHNDQEIRLNHPRPLTVGVLLDCPEQNLTFYSVSAESQTIIHTCRVHIPTRLFPAVWLFGLKPGNSLTILDLQKPTQTDPSHHSLQGREEEC